MSTTEVLRPRSAPISGEHFEYRPLCTGAVASMVFGALSTLLFVAGRDSFEGSLLLSPLPLIGIALGWRALARMRDNPGQFSGGGLAKAGLALSAACLLGGLAFSGYVYATEVPVGYARTSFFDLKPDEVDLRGDQLVPEDIARLDGQKVFIKGYIRPDSVRFRQNVGQFLLVRDNNNCCFGDIGTVKYFDQVAVECQGPLRVDYSSGLFRMGGTLRVDARNAGQLSAGPVYRLEADYAK